MRKLFIVLVLIILIGIQILAGNVTYSADLSKQLKQEMELLEQKHSPYGSIFELTYLIKNTPAIIIIVIIWKAYDIIINKNLLY